MALKGAAEWTPIYMLIVIIIAAVLIYTLIKPTFQAAANVATGNLEESKTAIRTASYLLGLKI